MSRPWNWQRGAAVGDRRPRRCAVVAPHRVGARAALRPLRRALVPPAVLVHVEHGVDPVLLRPADGLGDLVDVGLVELPALGLESRPREPQPHDVEALLGDVGEVVLGERPGVVDVGTRTVEVHELVHVHAAQQHLVAVAVGDDVVVGAEEADRHVVGGGLRGGGRPGHGSDERDGHREHRDDPRRQLQRTGASTGAERGRPGSRSRRRSSRGTRRTRDRRRRRCTRP